MTIHFGNFYHAGTMPVLVHALFVLFLTLPLCRAAEPQMTWEGPLKKKAEIGFGRNRVVIGCKTCASFRQLLPAKEQTVRAEVVQGKGTVHLIEHPIDDNQYFALARFEPGVKGEQIVRIHFYWDPEPPSTAELAARQAAAAAAERAAQTEIAAAEAPAAVGTPGIAGGGGASPPGGAASTVGGLLGGVARGVLLGRMDNAAGGNRITWSGRVDGTILVRCRGLRCGTKTVEGQSVSNVQYNVGAALPAQDLELTLAVIQGRGEVAIIEQPNADNRYAVTLQITDSASKAGDYRLELTWRQ